MTWTEPHNAITAKQQQKSFMLIHKTRGKKTWGHDRKEAVEVRDVKSGTCRRILPIKALPGEAEGVVYPSVVSRPYGVMNGIDQDC